MPDIAYELIKDKRSILCAIPSHIESLDALLHKYEVELKAMSTADLAGVLVVLRELLRNAVVHGGKGASDRTVRARVDVLGEHAFRICVADEGLGFDYRTLDLRVPEDPRDLRKRGYVLIGNIAQAVMFNERGNAVTAWVADGG